MRRKAIVSINTVFLYCAILFQYSSCSAVQDSTSDKKFMNDNNAFALSIYKKVSTEKTGNFFLSPYSISTALAMTYAGARKKTAKQMAQVLNFSSDQNILHASFASLQKSLEVINKKGHVQLNNANSLWLQKKYVFKKDYISLVKENYGSKLNFVDFAKAELVRGKINGWVEKETQKTIKDLIQPGIISDLTVLVLANAIYFKGDWDIAFKKEDTEDREFFTNGKKSISIPMMYQKQKHNYLKNDLCQVLQMNYIGDDLSLVVLLPAQKDSLQNFEDKLSCELIETWLCEVEEKKVEIYIPKFKNTSEFELKNTLVKMGMKEPFLKSADFSGMSKKKDLFISKIIHKAFVDINEEGTEAAAATAVIMTRYSAELIPEFNANHPFIYFIRDNQSGTILFIGRYKKPATI